jgi:hypothetical protein
MLRWWNKNCYAYSYVSFMLQNNFKIILNLEKNLPIILLKIGPRNNPGTDS